VRTLLYEVANANVNIFDQMTDDEQKTVLAALKALKDALSYDFSRRRGEKEPLGEGGCPLVSGEGRIGSTLTV
jgi:hypothetical protein